jgi:hypothetical protein
MFEYLGPPPHLFYYFPQVYTYALYAWCFHYAKREFETFELLLTALCFEECCISMCTCGTAASLTKFSLKQLVRMTHHRPR